MKTLKTTISAILIAISITISLANVFTMETTYAAEPACVKTNNCPPGTPLTTKTAPAKKKTPVKTAAQIAADKAATAAKAAEEAAATKKAADELAACKQGGFATCADKKAADDIKAAAAAAADKNSITNGTFSVNDQLKLDGDNQEKAYFKGTGSPIVNFVMSIINYAITIMGAIAVILFIVAGFMFMAANGESQKLDNAKDIIKYAAIGLIVALLSYIITIFVQSIFANG